MSAIREDSKADRGGRRGFILRWLAVTLVLLALGIAGLSNAQAQPLPADPATSIATLHDASGPDGAHCCHESHDRHDGESCPAPTHCGGCAVDGDKLAAPVLAPASHRGLRLTSLPAGLVTGPAGHPPKAIRSA